MMEQLAKFLLEKERLLATAESCTGGMLGMKLTAIAGSSKWYMGGFITYSNLLKERCLDVSKELINARGAVSLEVAGAMAIGAALHAYSHCALSITGIAGPSGGTEEKPVGTVFIGSVARAELQDNVDDADVIIRHYFFKGNREAVRRQSCEAAVNQLLHQLRS